MAITAESKTEKPRSPARRARSKTARANKDQRPSILFAVKAIATTVGGGLLTLALALTQVWYSDHLEMRRRQHEMGAQYQERLFDLTGAIEVAVLRTMQSIREGNLAQARQLQNETLASLINRWQSARFLLRNRGAAIYGTSVGNFIYNPSERSFILDRCSVVVRIDNSAMDRHCANRRLEEHVFLHGFRDRVVRSDDFRPFRSEPRVPTSFHVNLEIVDRLLRRVINCVAPVVAAASAAPTSPPRPRDPRCEDVGHTIRILELRYDLLVTARSNLADAIVESSALTN